MRSGSIDSHVNRELMWTWPVCVPSCKTRAVGLEFRCFFAHELVQWVAVPALDGSTCYDKGSSGASQCNRHCAPGYRCDHVVIFVLSAQRVVCWHTYGNCRIHSWAKSHSGDDSNLNLSLAVHGQAGPLNGAHAGAKLGFSV